MRFIYTFYLIIFLGAGEAKNLQGRNGETRDVYCTVALDQEEIMRTATVERTLDPFFCEEYQFEIPRKFRYLAVYLYDRDRHLKQDRAIGKIAIKREELHVYNYKDHWFSLRPVDADSEVQGMINIEVSIDEGCGNLKRKSNFDETGGGGSISLPSSSSFGGISSSGSNSSSTGNDLKENHGASGGGGSVSRSESVKTSSSMFGSKTRSLFGGGSGGTHSTELSVWLSSSSSASQSKRSAATTIASNVVDPFRMGGHDVKSRCTISVLQCSELARKNGNCDPYVTVTALYTNHKKVMKRTKVQKRTVSPQFSETVTFDLCIDFDGGKLSSGNNAYTVVPLEGADLCEIAVAVWHDAGMGEHIFLGEVKLPMRGKQQQASVQPNAWYFLQPRTTGHHSKSSSSSALARSSATPPGTRLSGENTLGSMRLQLVYSADYVFPLVNYDLLLNMLLKSLDHRPVTSSAVYLLGELIAKPEVAPPLVRIFTHKNCISPMIKVLADHEISKLTDPTTIFRGNTLVSKMMDEAMRLSGLHYLHATLKPIVDAIVTDRKPCEIDPTRVKDMSTVDANLINLQEYVERVFEAITKSAVHCPAVLCQIFHDLRECAAKHFPNNKEVRYSVVSGFIFLRFFAPAILGPKLFDLTTQPLVNIYHPHLSHLT